MRTIPRTRHTVDECNPFGMDQRRSARCVLDKPINFPDLDPTLEEYGNPSGFYMEGSSSVIQTGYKAKTYPSSSYLLYKWEVIGATVVAGGSGHNFVEVETRSNNPEDIFTVNLIVKNAEQEDNVSQNFSHTRVEKLYEIELLDIVEDIAGSCEFDTTLLCRTSSTYSANFTHEHGIVNYTWSCQGAPIIDNGDGTATVTTYSDEDVTFLVSLVLEDDHSSDSRSEEFVHSRTENVIIPVVVTDITEDIAGSCEWVGANQCAATSIHTAIHENGDTFKWSSANATILSGQGTESVTVETENHVDITFDLQCIVANGISTKKIIRTFTHTRAESDDPVAIVSLSELSAGSCEFPSAGTCQATSTYQVVGTDYDTIVWNITGATLVSGQGTDTVTVSTDGGVDTLFDVGVTLNGFAGGSANTSGSYSHTRTEILDEFLGTFLYDETNIATEFLDVLNYFTPIMTSNNQNGYITTANTTLGGNDNSYLLFNREIDNVWHSDVGGGATGLITLELPVAKKLYSGSIINRDLSINIWAPTNLIINGSNDGINYDTLYSFSNLPGGQAAETEFIVASDVAYKYWKFNITNSQSYVAVAELNLFEKEEV